MSYDGTGRSDGGDYGGSYWGGGNTNTADSASPSVPLTPTDVNSWGSVKNVTAPSYPSYSTPYGDYSLQDMFKDDWGVPSVPLTPETIKSWGNVTEAQGVLGALPSSEGIFGNSMNQEYGPDGETLGFQTSPFGRKAVGVARSLANLNPYGRVANMGVDAYNGVSPLKIAANAIPGNLGLVSRMGADVAGGAGVGETVGKNVGGALGGFGAGGFTRGLLGEGLGGTLASMVAGQQGSQIGAQVGKQVANADTGTNMNSPFAKFASFMGGGTTTPSTTSTGPRSLPEQQSPLGSLIGGLGSLYLGNQAISGMNTQRDAIQQQQAMQQQGGGMPSLAEMYGPNSPYALQLRQTLARQDAKAGRNSQYGAREAQLQALLAEKGSQYASQQASASSANSSSNLAQQKYLNDMNMQQQQIRAQQLGSLYDFGRTSGINGAIGRGLGSLYDQYAPKMYEAFSGSNETQQPYSYEEA